MLTGDGPKFDSRSEASGSSLANSMVHSSMVDRSMPWAHCMLGHSTILLEMDNSMTRASFSVKG